MDNGFRGEPGQIVPEMTPERVGIISDRYIELYEKLIGKEFQKESYDEIYARIEENIKNMLARLPI